MEDSKKDKVAIMLSGGGARAAYQLGVLKYIFTELNCVPESPIFIGTSAGAINAFYLTVKAHEGFPKAISDLCEIWSNLKIQDVYKTDTWSLLKLAGNFFFNFTLGRFTGVERHIESLLNATPLYFTLRKIFEEDAHLMTQNIQSGYVHALGLTCMQYGTGKSITFFDTADPHIQEWDRHRREGRQTKLRLKHVLASAAIPLIFPAVKLEQAYYGDGSVRSAAPLSSSIKLGATKILVVHLRARGAEDLKPLATYPSVSQITGMMLNTFFLDSLDFDLGVLKRMNDIVSKTPTPITTKNIDVEVIRPSQDLGKTAIPFKKDIPYSLAFLLKGLGPTISSGADFLSYLLFDGKYAKALIQLGFDDAHAYRNELLKFFSTIKLKA